MLDNLSSRQILAGGDIKEITDVIKKDLLTLLMTQILTNDNRGYYSPALVLGLVCVNRRGCLFRILNLTIG